MQAKKILITGAYGLIGNKLFRHLDGPGGGYEVYGLGRRKAPSKRLKEEASYVIDRERYAVVDIADFEAVKRSLQGMDVVVHMAADPGSEDWQSIRSSNLTGAYNVLEAARQNAVKRVVLASTVQVNRGYALQEEYEKVFAGECEELPAGFRRIRHTDPVKPVSLYGASKVWTEALAHVYAHAHGVSCLCVRIGWVTPSDWPDRRMVFPVWCSARDATAMIELCIEAPMSLRFDVFYAVSDNRCGWADIDHAREVLGYEPRDHSEDYRERFRTQAQGNQPDLGWRSEAQ